MLKAAIEALETRCLLTVNWVNVEPTTLMPVTGAATTFSLSAGSSDGAITSYQVNFATALPCEPSAATP